MTDQNNRPGLDEKTFGKLIEAAYVLQEHNREVRKMEESLELHSEQLREQESARHRALPEKNQEAQENLPPGDYTLTLAEIVEAQHQIQRRHLELDAAMAVVAERVARITNASGAGIGLLQGKMVRYRAGAGSPALPTGSEVPLDTAVCAASVRTGQVIRSENVSQEFLFDAEGCLQRGIQSLVSVPIYHDGNIAGALELYFDKIHGYIEQDVHTCQLMAGLVTEAIGRDTESSLKASVASERSTMLEAIERLKPDLIALVDQTSASMAKKAGASAVSVDCRRCGGAVLPEEQFCGKCGASRVGENETSEIQRKVEAAWRLQQTNQETSRPAARSAGAGLGGTPKLAPKSAPKFTPAPSILSELEREEAQHDAKYRSAHGSQDHSQDRAESVLLPGWDEPIRLERSAASDEIRIHANDDATPAPFAAGTERDEKKEDEDADEESVENDLPVPHTALGSALVKQPGDVTWTSAAKAREFLEAIASTRAPGALARFWHDRRGTFYLVMAVILVLIVIRWGILSGDHPVSATAHGTAVSGSATRHKEPAPDADLSAWDKLLISLGLADPPEAPEYKGNPDVRVWVDLHTALYYCPGSDLYGKTPKGKYASQRDAELDQFEPAERKACE